MKPWTTGGVDPFLRIRIDKSSPIPAYAQIGDAIKKLLSPGAIPTGTALPPERVLCERLGVSRMTLRQAFGALEREGLIESHRGLGKFVAPRRMQKKQQEMRSFTEELRARGQTPSSRLLAFRLIKQSSADRDFFALAATEMLYEVERVRFADGVPIAVEQIHIPEYLCPKLDRFNLATQSIYAIMEENYGLTLARCTEQISAVYQTKAQKHLLQVPPHAVVLVVNRKTYTDQETPVELATTTYRGDLYTAVVHSVRNKG